MNFLAVFSVGWVSALLLELKLDRNTALLWLRQMTLSSGVIHAGIYYAPGSDMATLCVEGAKRLYEYCDRKNLPHKRVGKFIVATREDELPILEELYERAKANKVQGLELLDSKRIQDLEPNVRALRALHSPNTGIVDYPSVGRAYAKDFMETGRGFIHTGSVVPDYLYCCLQN